MEIKESTMVGVFFNRVGECRSRVLSHDPEFEERHENVTPDELSPTLEIKRRVVNEKYRTHALPVYLCGLPAP